LSAGVEGYEVSDATDRIDVGFVCAALAGSYWAQNRPRAVVEESIRNSLCLGVFKASGGGQVAFARVVTDGATFSWLCDVVVDGAHRGRGLGKLLVSSALRHPRVRGTTFLLGTRDAHGLYEPFGFARAEVMRRPVTPGMPNPTQIPPPASP
jgi:GNAT superfamily N-acetyltransferase